MNKLPSESEFLAKYNIDKDAFLGTKLKWQELEKIYDKHVEDTPFLESHLMNISSPFLKVDHVHTIRYRVKTPEHLIEKIIRKKIDNPDRNITFKTYYREIDDLMGIRVLHLFKDEWQPSHDFILNKWKLKEQPTAYHRKGDSEEYLNGYSQKNCVLKEHKYGYRSVHYIIKEKILSTDIACEIQVRTIFEEAWSEIDHTIRYPHDMNNPIFKNYLMIFNRLAGSADEMGTFLIMLKEHIAELHYNAKEEKAKANKLIKELQNEVSRLKIDKENLESINQKLQELGEEVSDNDQYTIGLSSFDENKNYLPFGNFYNSYNSLLDDSLTFLKPHSVLSTINPTSYTSFSPNLFDSNNQSKPFLEDSLRQAEMLCNASRTVSQIMGGGITGRIFL